MIQQKNIKRKAVSGIVWTALQKYSQMFIHFISGIILARLLMLYDYGCIGMLSMFMVSAIRWVDEVVTYNNVDLDIQHIDFDVFAKGPEQQHAGFQRAVAWCEANGKQVVIIPRKESISSTMLREYSKVKYKIVK